MVESLDSPDSQTSTALYSLCPRLPITYNEAALSQLQGRQQVIICNNLSLPLPSDSECSADDTDGDTSSDETSTTHGSPAEVVADSSCLQRESPTAGTGTDMPTTQAVPLTSPMVIHLPNTMRKMPSIRQSQIPIGIRSLQDHSQRLTGPPVTPSRTTRSTGTATPLTRPSGLTTDVRDASNPPDRTSSPSTPFVH